MDEIENDPQAIQDEAPPEDQAQPLPRAINVATQRRRSRLFSHQPIVEEDVLVRYLDPIVGHNLLENPHAYRITR